MGAATRRARAQQENPRTFNCADEVKILGSYFLAIEGVLMSAYQLLDECKDRVEQVKAVVDSKDYFDAELVDMLPKALDAMEAVCAMIDGTVWAKCRIGAGGSGPEPRLQLRELVREPVIL